MLTLQTAFLIALGVIYLIGVVGCVALGTKFYFYLLWPLWVVYMGLHKLFTGR